MSEQLFCKKRKTKTERPVGTRREHARGRAPRRDGRGEKGEARLGNSAPRSGPYREKVESGSKDLV